MRGIQKRPAAATRAPQCGQGSPQTSMRVTATSARSNVSCLDKRVVGDWPGPPKPLHPRDLCATITVIFLAVLKVNHAL